MKSRLSILIIVLIFTFSSCENSNTDSNFSYKGEEQSRTDMAEVNSPPPPPPLNASFKFAPEQIEDAYAGSDEEENVNSDYITSSPNSSSLKKMIIRDGDMSIKTSDIHSAKKAIDELIKKLNGYYESENLHNGDRMSTFDLRIRVPSENFEKLISNLENGKDEITHKNIQARDVTEEFVDTQTRLSNKRDYLKRYKELLSKASTVKDIIAIEENIRTLQEEIESKEGRLKYLKDQVSYSTLNVTLFHEKEFVYKPKPKDSFFERVKDSLNNGWTLIVDFILWIVTIWPFLILAPALIYIFRRLRKKRDN